MTGNPPTTALNLMLIESIPIESEHLASSVRDLIPMAEDSLVHLAGSQDPDLVEKMASGAERLLTAKQALEQYEREREANNGLTPEQVVRTHLRNLVPFASRDIGELDDLAESEDDESEVECATDKLDAAVAYLHVYRHESPTPNLDEGDIPF